MTTADHFSQEAINARNTVIEKNSVESFELYDYKRFFDMLNLYRTEIPEVWKKLQQFEENLPKTKNDTFLN